MWCSSFEILWNKYKIQIQFFGKILIFFFLYSHSDIFRIIKKYFITLTSLNIGFYSTSSDCHVCEFESFRLVNLSPVDWNECSRDPNFGGRLDSSSNFLLDSVACFRLVRSLWLRTDFIVLAKNRLFVVFVFIRHPLGPTSSANFDARNVSRWISSIARLENQNIVKLDRSFGWGNCNSNEFSSYFVKSGSHFLFGLSLPTFEVCGLLPDSVLCSFGVFFIDFCLFFRFRRSFWVSNCFFSSSDDIFVSYNSNGVLPTIDFSGTWKKLKKT